MHQMPENEPRGRHHVGTLAAFISECPGRLRGSLSMNRTGRIVAQFVAARRGACYSVMSRRTSLGGSDHWP